MPSRNSINKPKDKILRNKHSLSIGKKRASRKKHAEATASSTSRYNADELAPRPTESKSVALFRGNPSSDATKITTKSLSKKRIRKLERNQKYINKRNENLKIDIIAQQEDMQVDDGGADRSEKKVSDLEKVKKIIWSAVEDRAAGGLDVGTGREGSGTTLGVQAF